MNGRAYDYNTGRFQSVDPFIQSPADSQSVNPYSYIMNNPLAGTDPTGYIARPTAEGHIKNIDGTSPGGAVGKCTARMNIFGKFLGTGSCFSSGGGGYATNGGDGKTGTEQTSKESEGKNAEANESLNPSDVLEFDGTYFFGGAGMNGDYIEDMIVAFEEAGISDVHAVDGERWSMNSGLDAAIGVLALNEEVELGDRVHTTPERLINRGDGEGQLNLVGYSYGSLVAAHVAMTRVQKGGTVDNLVLVGSPITQGFLDTLRSTEGIRNVIVKDLVDHGDPIKAGMSGMDVVISAPRLAYQMTQSSGHFYYAPSNAAGMNRRRELAKELYDGGLR